MVWRLLIFILFLSSCAPEQEMDEELPFPTHEQFVNQCEINKGGKVIACDTETGYACALPTGDGGTPCTDHSQCEAECVANQSCDIGETGSGTCSGWTLSTCQDQILVYNGTCYYHAAVLYDL